MPPHWLYGELTQGAWLRLLGLEQQQQQDEELATAGQEEETQNRAQGNLCDSCTMSELL